MMVPKRNQAGFTLIDLLLACAILSFLLLGTAQIIRVSCAGLELNRNAAGAFEDANHAMALMVREIRRSQASKLTIRSATDLAATDLDEVTTEFYWSDGKLYRRSGGVTTLLAQNVSAFQVSQGEAAPLVRLRLTVADGSDAVQLQETVRPRN
jgi:type II secretory pathway pseudopilin PulG